MCTQLHRQHVVADLLEEPPTGHKPSRDKLLAIEWSLLFYVVAWGFESMEELRDEIRDIYDHSDQLGFSYIDRFSRLGNAVQEWQASRTFWKWLDLSSLLCSALGAFLRIMEFQAGNIDHEELARGVTERWREAFSGLGVCGRSRFCSDQVCSEICSLLALGCSGLTSRW